MSAASQRAMPVAAAASLVPVLDASGHETGHALEVAGPPPPELVTGGARYELRAFRECRQFGCGCLWEERIGYVADAPPATTNDESEGR